jgi:hypothetical protein
MPVQIALDTDRVRDLYESVIVPNHLENASAFLAQAPQQLAHLSLVFIEKACLLLELA